MGKRDNGKRDNGKRDNETFENVLSLASIFDTHMDKYNREVSWKAMRAELEVLPISDLEMLLGLVKTKRKANRLKEDSNTLDSKQ